ncbi:MAG: hypothetical protein HY761_03220 [Candidatus Omnitrophica bacterium]|nr:hypothetical protein [Candidatus Omnitrophota bacterium]
MHELKTITNKTNLTGQDLDALIIKVKQNYRPYLCRENAPEHCGLCVLFPVCKVVNHNLICPWLTYGGK